MSVSKNYHLSTKRGEWGNTRNLNSARMVATTCKLLLMNGFRSYSLHDKIGTSFFILTAFTALLHVTLSLIISGYAQFF